jgi:hypothetical protein
MKRSEKIKQQDPSPDRGQTVAVIGSATYAAKAREALARAAVRAEVVKLSYSTTHAGCVYGVAFPSVQTPNAAYVLDRAGIAVREYMESDS